MVGYLRGDGCSGNIFRISATTVSCRLADGLRRLMVSARVGLPSIQEHKDRFRYSIKTRDAYIVYIGGKGNYKMRKLMGLPLPVYDNARARYRLENSPGANQGFGYWKRGNRHYWTKVREKEVVEYCDDMYDLGVSGEEKSFLTVNFSSHNCLASEVAFWDKADDKMQILEASVPVTGSLVVESTPNGVGNYFHQLWDGAVDGKNGYVPWNTVGGGYTPRRR